MEILARGIGRRKEAVAQVQIIKGTGQFIINNVPAQQYLGASHPCSIISAKSPLLILCTQTENTNKIAEMPTDLDSLNNKNFDTIVKVKGGGLVGQAEAIKLGLARALCQLSNCLQSIKSTSMVSQETTLAHITNNNGNSEFVSQVSSETQQINNAHLNSLNFEEIRKQLKDKGYLTQDSRVKERRKYGLKKARKASQYHKR